MLDLEEVLQRGLEQAEAGWNMGSFGVIAEFHHVDEEPPPRPAKPLTQVTNRGGVRIERLEGVQPVAYETLSPRAHRWSQAVSLCLPKNDAEMNRRDVLTELGLDETGLREQDRNAVLFDMGLAQPQVDFCIRTSDAKLIADLRQNEGRSLMEHDNPAMGAILNAHPHRIALTQIGRIEVYQMIGGPDTGGISPEGPHTHVLPKLLRAKRTHSANTPIPEGWVPCAGFHPESPVFRRLGEDKPFNREAFDTFQAMLQAWGPEVYREAKAACWAAIEKGEEPENAVEPSTRTGRAGLRNGLRQWRRIHGDSLLLERWSARFDASTVGYEADDENLGH